jgi:hypothetical protein
MRGCDLSRDAVNVLAGAGVAAALTSAARRDPEVTSLHVNGVVKGHRRLGILLLRKPGSRE